MFARVARVVAVGGRGVDVECDGDDFVERL